MSCKEHFIYDFDIIIVLEITILFFSLDVELPDFYY